ITGVTCEANAMLSLADQVKEACGSIVVVGGIQASSDPEFFNRPQVDYIVTGLGKKTFAELVAVLEEGRQPAAIPGVARTSPGQRLSFPSHICSRVDLVDDRPPAYELVQDYRGHYLLPRLGLNMGFVSTAFGCPHNCSFCCLKFQTGGKYLTRSREAVIRDIELLEDIPVIRLLDANTFADPAHSRNLCQALQEAGIKKQYLADARSDSVTTDPGLFQKWRETGLRAVIIGFEEIDDKRLQNMNKANQAAVNTEAIAILHDIGLTMVGDFIISPDYREEDFDRLQRYIETNEIGLPMLTVMTPLPGTRLYQEQKDQIIHHNLDYYTLTNAVLPTRMPEKRFYQRYAELLRNSHTAVRL
ncbi:MAG: B12-binding domain-containing radical SAM protein, partial [Thermodesulfobacteriota bacterium]